MNELTQYLKNNKVTPGRLQGEIYDARNERIPTRNAFVLLKKMAKGFFVNAEEPRMIALSGLRGVGKTTLAWQVADYVYYNHTPKIYFISIDDLNRLGVNLYDAFHALEKILGSSFAELNEKIMLIIDEVHETAGWQKDLKILYENGKNIFTIATGSSALLLHSSPDLATRWTLLKIFPFRFTEFVLVKSWLLNPKSQIFPIKDVAVHLKEILFFENDYQDVKRKIILITNIVNEYFKKIDSQFKVPLQTLIDEHISYHNIPRFLYIQNKTLIIDRIIGLFDRILQKDIPEYNRKLVNIYSRLLFRIALSDEINFQTLSKELKLKESDIENMIQTLHQAEILNIFLPYGGIKTKTGSTKKIFFMSPSLRRALYAKIYGENLKNELRAKLYEDIVAMYLKRILEGSLISFGFGQKKNPDFIIETLEKPVVIEVGINKTSSDQIKSFGNYRYGIIINSKIDDVEFDDIHRIIFLPLKWFLLL